MFTYQFDLANISPPLLTVLLQIVKKVELEAQRAKGPNEAKGGRRRRNPVEDLKREVAIMRTLRHKNIVSLQVGLLCHVCSHAFACLPLRHDIVEVLLLCLLCPVCLSDIRAVGSWLLCLLAGHLCFPLICCSHSAIVDRCNLV